MNYLQRSFRGFINLWPTVLGELRSLAQPGPRMIDEFECVISVLLAIVFAHALGAQNIGWAAFSGYAVMRSRLSESLTRGTLRIIGTAAGAGVALLLAPYVLASPYFLSLALAIVGGFTLYFALIGRRSYAWLFTGLTFCMILIDGMRHPAASVVPFARSRFLEIVAGTLASLLVSAVSAFILRHWKSDQKRETASQAAVRHSMLWHAGALQHSIQAAIALAFIPFVWMWFGVTSLAQSSVTIMVVMMIPVTSLGANAFNPVTSKLVLRFVGCSLGGVIAIAILLGSHHSPVLMTLGVCLGVLVGRHIENGNATTSYIGTQFVLAFLVVLVPDNYLNAMPDPGIDRLAGILLGMVILEPVLILTYLVFGRRKEFTQSEDGEKSTPRGGEPTE
ncbi:FUSC family protein [Phyllobacterium sp. LjRoot231]|uniref:FUSC family protein n=1 Tax=Phyllobacterium sp. LjRoot231 TaxID=3342289 RepID=UPI003ECFACA6